MSPKKSPRLLTGLLSAAPVTAAWLGVSYALWRLAGLPFAPFDLFDWVTRVLPGPVLAVGIDSMVLFIQVLGVEPLAAAAKVAEQSMAIGGAFILGSVLGTVLCIVIRRPGVRFPRLVGLCLGLLCGGVVASLTLHLSQTARTPPAITVLGLGVEFGVWGLIAAAAGRRLVGGRLGPERADEPVSFEPEVQRLDRRRFLVRLGGSSAILTVTGAVVGEVASARRKQRFDANLGKPWSATHPLPNANALPAPAPGTRAELTPLERHYRIDIDTTPPELDLETWKLQVFGLVERPVAFAIEELRSYEPLHQFVTLACVSNPVGGTLTGTTRWTGVSLQRLLPVLRLKPNATHLKLRAADGFFEVVAVEDIRKDPRIMLTYAWDGLPLHPDHGFPLRIYIPDVYGMKQPKWLVSLEAMDHCEPGYWVARGWDKTARMKATSAIDVITAAPADAARSQLVRIGGIAHAGARGISRVEVRVDDAAWQPAVLRPPLSSLSWVIWRYDWPFRPGSHTFTVRCFEADGTPQSETTHPPRPSGATGLVSRTLKERS